MKNNNIRGIEKWTKKLKSFKEFVTEGENKPNLEEIYDIYRLNEEAEKSIIEANKRKNLLLSKYF